MRMDKIEELLTRGVDKIYPSYEELEKNLRSVKKLRLYQGFDPTGVQMHIGHMIGLRKLKQWQNLGHEVIFLIGDGTGQAGDPSGKTRAREKFLSNTELRANAKDYVMQASKIVRFEGDNAVKILYNGDWLNKLTLPEILDIIGHFSFQQLAERDLFEKRMQSGETLNIREFFYPVLQAYDSVEMEVDLELGGSDQTFNMLCGRTLLKAMKGKDKFVMTTPLLSDSEGRKIGKTEGNVIALNDKPEDLYGKIMSLSDDVIVKGLEYLTDIPIEEVKQIEKKLKEDENPIIHKKRLAFEIVRQLSSEGDARTAQQEFEKVVQHKETPTGDLKIKPLNSGATITDALIELGFSSSRSEAKRLVEQGGATVANKTINDPTFKIPEGESLIKVGNRKFGKVKIN